MAIIGGNDLRQEDAGGAKFLKEDPTTAGSRPNQLMRETTTRALCLLQLLTITVRADQQKICAPTAMTRVDLHTHMGAKAVEAMDQWGGTISITFAGLFWVKDINGNHASPASVRQLPGDDIVYVKEKLAKIFDTYPNVFIDIAFTHNARQQAQPTVSKARQFYIQYRDRILFGSDVFAAGADANGFLNERKILEAGQVTNGLHGGLKLAGLKLPDPVLNHIDYWNAVRLIPRVRQVLDARNFKISFELGTFQCDRLPPDVTVDKLTLVRGQPGDLTGTLGSLTSHLTVEIAGRIYPSVDHLNGTWKVPGIKLAGLPPGTCEVKVTAKNSIGIVRTDSSTHELTVVSRPRSGT